MLEWPQERRMRKDREGRAPSSHSSSVSFGQRVQADTAKLTALTDGLREAFRANSEPESALVQLRAKVEGLLSSDDANSFEDPVGMALTAACVEVLRREPTAAMWEFIWSLAWHSSPLEHGLPQAVIEVANEDPDFKGQFLDIATEVVRMAVADPGRRAITRDRDAMRQWREHWNEIANLDEVWWGLRAHGYVMYRDDDGVLGIVASLDPRAFVQLLAEFDQPYSVASALDWPAGAIWSFDRWRTLLQLAPVAFDMDGVWNGSVIAPYLLCIASDQLNQGRARLGPNLKEEDLKEASDETDALIREIVKVIASRGDGSPCAMRWATWLMRHAIGALAKEQPPYPVNVRSPGYAESALIETLAKESAAITWLPSCSSDAKPWEVWCYRCVLVSVALVQRLSPPGIDAFLESWRISPDEWSSEKGEVLRERASIFEVFGQRADAYGTRLLALPLAEALDPVGVWKGIWDATGDIREIIEFGDADSEGQEGWRRQSDASNLMQLAFGLGLMMLDHMIVPTRELKYDRRSAAGELVHLLTDFVHELEAIDRLDRGYWRDAMRHLAIRRAVWLSAQHIDGSQAPGIALDPGITPTLVDYIRDLAGNVENLLAFIDVALRNQVDRGTLRAAIDGAGIDLSSTIEFAERLMKLDPRRAGVGEAQLSAGRSLLVSAT